MREPVIVDVVRTTFGKSGGALSNWHPVDLLAFTLNSLVERTGIDPERIDDVIGGCVSQVGEQGTNVTRNAWVAAGLPQIVPATTIDRQCGSSQQAVHFAAAGVAAGHYDLVVACGVEVMSRVPMGSNSSGGTGPFPPSFMENVDGRLWTQFRVSQVLADRYGITREQMDEYALESHRRAAENWDNGHFSREAIPVPIKGADGAFTGESLLSDEGIRRTSSLAALAALKPAQHWEPDTAPDITAGNASQTTDGAAAMLIAERAVAEELGLPIRARFSHFAVTAEDAAIVLSAPVPVTHKLLGKVRDEGRGIRRRRMQRGLCRDRADVEHGLRLRPRAFQSTRRSDCDRPPAGCEWRSPHGDVAQSPRSNGRPLRISDDVRRGRAGQRHRHRAPGLSSRGRLGGGAAAVGHSVPPLGD